ncbi:MAG: tetratricopeptide repeat-containing serine/threonine-protein kinase [Thermoanaerobaculia bacterium]|nr:tetratricopeptide repeat-containing serine/threonine-protein kinase [Thermoanaerobaculia bacterium]
MGEVYRAFDPRLDRSVAVKHIRPEYASKRGYRKRLEREAKTVASLDHPSIVQIFDVLQDEDGGEWIVMELVDGPTVYEMLENGPLEIGTALTIALDVIHGLGQAHDRGVLHRDLKSENVMVSRAGMAKILDFGLSKRLTGEELSALSVEGRVIGTCRVMAPEQADGKELDSRADLFAFGILLYEMVTARSPFRASTPMASMLKAFGEPHAPVFGFNPDVPQELADLIDWLLEKNRENRPENAQKVAARLAEIAADVTDDPAELATRIRMASRSWHGSGAYALASQPEKSAPEESLDETVVGGPPVPSDDTQRTAWASTSRAAVSKAALEALSRVQRDSQSAGPDTGSRSRWSTMFSTAFGLGLPPIRRALAWTAWLLAIGAGWWTVTSMTRPVVTEPEDARIVVLPFENHGPEEMDFFSSGLTSEITRELMSRRGLAVVSFRTSNQYGTGNKSLREIRDELDVSHVLEGDVASSNGRFSEDSHIRINLRLIRASDGQLLLSQSLDRFASDTLRVQKGIADDVAMELGAQIMVDTRRDLSAEPRALDAYFRGLAIWHGTGYTAEVAKEAERLFEAAIDSDPTFLRAWTELSLVRSMIYFNGNSTLDRYRLAQEAVEKCRLLGRDTVGVLLASGYYEYQVEGDYQAARKEIERALALAPSQAEALEAIGFVLRRQGHLESAVEFFEKAYDLDRANTSLAGFLAETERARRRYERADTWFSIALRNSSDLPYVVGEQAENTLALLGCGNVFETPRCPVDVAVRVLDESNLSENRSIWGYRVRIALFEMANRGNEEAFLDIYDSVPEQDVETNERLRLFWRRVMALRDLGRDEDADVMVQRYVRELRDLADASEFAMHHALLGIALALAGEPHEATIALQQALKLSEQDRFTGPRVARWAAVVHLLLGEQEKAVSYLETIGRQDFQLSLASYEIQADPVWRPLREAGLLDGVWNELRERELAMNN